MEDVFVDRFILLDRGGDDTLNVSDTDIDGPLFANGHAGIGAITFHEGGTATALAIGTDSGHSVHGNGAVVSPPLAG